MFTGFPEETIRFLLDLRFHNNATFFDEHREQYRQEVQAPFYALIDDLAPFMQAIDPQMEVRPYKCMARIRRDTRFTKDKSPYRDHLWFLFRRAAEPRYQAVNYWFGFGPEELDWGLGFWGENRPAMDRLRRQIAAQPQRVLDVIGDCDLPGHHLALAGTTFKRMEVPPSVPPALRQLYLGKELYVTRVAPEYKWAFDDKLAGRVLKDFQTMAPMYRLLRGLYDDAQAAGEIEQNEDRR